MTVELEEHISSSPYDTFISGLVVMRIPESIEALKKTSTGMDPLTSSCDPWIALMEDVLPTCKGLEWV